ncbi:helix-turn-helix transcriptional regulator [Lysinibacillus boronitolerans]|uniref:helix-turn-helix domain-containing protein n=1 Tax=Lysinibacillus boronitolerans TaxID=309788 RepID=UPI0021618DD5|nr:helix-turn-helix transcriptional regulator [Lysinibacillus boronitolerans]MCS1393076.1 helix-turn-helix transcriptional regulator [Lysinibacillus boronitolerans]
MTFDYKPLFKTMIDKNVTREQIKKELQLSPATMAKLTKGENVSLTVLDKLCTFLDCEIEDVISHIKKPGSS